MTRPLPTGVRRLLGTSQLLAPQAPANVGVGDRRSKAIGSGLEFAQYRDYEPGDDLRHLDRHVYARFGKTTIRQFHQEQRLQVSVLLDASGSIGVDSASWQRSIELAGVFGIAAINGNDQVRLGVAKGLSVDWGTPVTREPQFLHELGRIASTTPGGGTGSFDGLAARSLAALGRPGILVVISDWLVQDYESALRMWRVRGQELVAVQVLGSAETESGRRMSGWLRLVDAESGEMLERRLSASTWERYRAEVVAWSERVRTAVWAVDGRWVSLEAQSPIDATTLRKLRGLGLIT